MKVNFLSFEMIHARRGVGSTTIRVHHLLRYWPEASLYQYGERPDVLIFQKVYLHQDYLFPLHYPGVKILDISDPDWLEGMPIKRTVDAMHAVTCPTEALAKFLRQLTDKPVVVIPDRYDLADFPEPKQHTKRAKTVVWFGYRHNAETIRPALELINRLRLNLLVISDDDPLIWQWLDRASMDDFRHNRYRFIKYSDNPKQVHRDLQEADFAVLPKGTRPQDAFKSDNKATRAILCGLPVSTTAEDVEAFLAPEQRSEWMQARYEKTREEFDCKRSVTQYRELIAQLMN